MNIRVLSVILLLCIISTSRVHSSDVEMIPNVLGYLNTNAKEKSPYQKLQIISNLKKKKRISGVSYNQLAQDLIIKHVYAKENDSPLKRLKAYNDAAKLSRIQNQGYLLKILVNEFLSTDSEYQSGSPVEKLVLLASYDKKYKFSSQYFIPKMKEIRSRELLNRLANKKIEERGMITLQFFSELKEKGFKSIYFNHLDEFEPLMEHLTLSKKFSKMDNYKKIEYLQNLYEKKLIDLQILSAFESIYYIDALSQDEKFIQMDNTQKKKFLEDKRQANELHFFTEGKIKYAFNIK